MRTIIKLYLWAENIWFRFPEKLRYLLVGGFNTVLAYALLNALDWLFGCVNKKYELGLVPEAVANAALLLQYVITINISVVTMRYYVFRSTGNWKKEFAKAWSVYIFLYLINAPIMTLLMVIFGLKTWAAQGIYLTFSTIITFFLHKYFSFRKKSA
jgi:putative flippase GtrA